MMKKGLLCTLASLLLGTSLATLAGGAIPMPPPFFSDNIRLVLSGAVAIEPETSVVEGVIDDDLIRNGNLDGDTFISFAPGFEIWLPMMTWPDQQINAVGFTNFIPGEDISAHAFHRRDDLGHADHVSDDTAYLKHWRLNWGIGVNYLRAFNDMFFMELMAGAGVSMYHAKAEFIEEADDADDSGSDHPGASTFNPFVMAELGLGIKVTEKSLIMAFADGYWIDHDDTFILSANNDDDVGFINVEPSSWFVLVGVKFARSIDL